MTNIDIPHDLIIMLGKKFIIVFPNIKIESVAAYYCCEMRITV